MRANQLLVSALNTAVFLMAASGANAFCSKFTPSPYELCIPDYPCENITSGLTGDTTNSVSYRTSTAVICTKQSPYFYSGCAFGGCIIQPSGTFYQPGVANITLADAELPELFSLISQTIGVNFSVSATVNVSAVLRNSECQRLGTAYMLAASPLFQCVDGVLDGCDGSSSVADGTAIRACEPVSDNYGFQSVLLTNSTAAKLNKPVPSPLAPVSMLDTGLRGPFSDPVMSPSPLPSSYITMVPTYTNPALTYS